MKYSFMSFSCPQLDLEETLLFAKQVGYDGIEPRVACGHKHGIETTAGAEERRKARKKITESGIALACIATSCQYADPASVKEQVEETRKCIDLAADVGADKIRVFGGAMPKGASRQSAVELLADSLSSVADYALERHVTVCLETHDDWSDPRQVAKVMKLVNHSSICANWDVLHPVRVGVTVSDSFQILKTWIRHNHFHDFQLKNLVPKPVGEGEVDHQKMIALLKDAHYDGFLSGEWIGWEPYQVHLPRELASMKRLESALG